MQLIDLFDRGAQRRPDRAALVGRSGRTSFTYRETQGLSHRVAAALRAAGVREGSRVAVISENDPFAFIAILGILRAGAVWVATNPRYTPDAMAELLGTARCEFLVVQDELAGVADHVCRHVDTISGTLTFARTDEGFAAPEWLEQEGDRARERPSADRDAVCMMMGTGGTTGKSKVVQLTHRNLLAMSLGFLAHAADDAEPSQLILAPMSHAAGLVTFPVFARGGTSVVHRAVVGDEILESIERFAPTRLFLPPTAIYKLLAHPNVRDCDYSSLRHFLYAAAPMSADRLAEALDVFGPVMTQTYGQVEAPMICTVLEAGDHVEALASDAARRRLASCGRPSLVADIAILAESGELAGVDEPGEILVRGDLVMRGYFDNAEATEATRHGEWHRTGDIGVVDADGFVYIVDRVKDMIISGGYNVYPSEIERVVWTHPGVADCAVIGIPHDEWGEQVTAVVEPKDGVAVDPAEVIAVCRAKLGSIKAPKQVIVRELPRSPVGKVLKRALRDEYWAGRERKI